MERSELGGRVKLDIFLVEDNPCDVALFKQVMRRSSIAYALTVARDGAEAIQQLKNRCASDEYRPDVVFLDLNLPGKNGTEVLADIRSDTNLAALPVAILTGSEDPADRANCACIGIEAYFNKAIAVHDFFALAAEVELFLLRLPWLARRSISAGFSQFTEVPAA